MYPEPVILPGVNSVALAQAVISNMMEIGVVSGSTVSIPQGNTLNTVTSRPNTRVMPRIIDLKMEVFSDGEFAPVIQDTIRDRRVFILQHTQTPEEILQLCMTIDAVKRCSGEKAVVILPYMPFSRQEKTMDKRTSIGAKVIANLLMAAGADAVICFDLHAPAIAGFFDDVPVDMINGTAIFCDYIKSLGIPNEELCFASPDVGGAKRAKAFRKHFPGSKFAICDKERPGANQVGEMELIGDVTGLHVIYIDDVVDTAGTVCKASDLAKAKGAATVRAIITHPVMSGPAYERLEASAIMELVVSDSIPLKRKSDKITVVSIAPTLAKAMLRLGSSQSLSVLNE